MNVWGAAGGHSLPMIAPAEAEFRNVARRPININANQSQVPIKIP